MPGSLEPDGVALPYTIQGELCAAPGELQNGSTVQLLIHGDTYNHSYWDFGAVDGIKYSYAKDLGTGGFPTFAIDEIGAGQSTHPASDHVTLGAAAYVAHEAVQGLRDGSLTGVQFGKVIDVGVSIGTTTAWQEAISYQDVDGLIATSQVHFFTAAAFSLVPQDLFSANMDPKFQNQSWASDPNYFTTKPNCGCRSQVYYYAPGADPNVIAADDNETPFSQETFDNERGKDVFAQGEVPGAVSLDFSADPLTGTPAIHVPVLIILGRKDVNFCGANTQGQTFDCSSGNVIAQQEAPYYSPQAQLEACSVPNSGMAINLHYNFGIEEAASISWSYHFVGQNGQYGNGQLPHACGWSG